MKELLSVAMATYNGEKYIREQLDSILGQTIKPYEIVISDDCSSDSTLEIVWQYAKKYNDVKWTILSQKENRGFIKNFRNALSHITGDIIFLCDQDDVWQADKIKQILSVFRSNSNIMCLNTDFKLIDEHGNSIPDNSLKENWLHVNVSSGAGGAITHINITSLFSYNCSPGCTMAVRREAVENYNLYSKQKYAHDYELNIISALWNDSVYFLNKPLTNYRIHKENTIGIPGKRNLRYFLGRIKSHWEEIIYEKEKMDYLSSIQMRGNWKSRDEIDLLREFIDLRYEVSIENKKWKIIKEFLLWKSQGHKMSALSVLTDFFS